MDESTFDQKVKYYQYIIKSNNRNNLLFPLIAIATILLITVILNFFLPDVQAPDIIKQVFVFTMAFLVVKIAYGVYRFFKLKTDLMLIKMKKDRK